MPPPPCMDITRALDFVTDTFLTIPNIDWTEFDLPAFLIAQYDLSTRSAEETRLRNFQSQNQRQKVDEDGDANNASSSAPDVVPFRQSQIGNVVDGDLKRPGQDFESEANNDAGMPISGRDSDLNVSGSSQKLVFQLKGRRDNKGSAFSPVDWSKTSESPEISSTTRVVQITPKVKLKLTPPHLKGTETTPTPPASARPFKPATPQDIATMVAPSRSYTLPALPEGSVAALRQQTFGTPYLDFDTGNQNNRTTEMDEDGGGRVQMVIGADAGERMLSPESQLSGEDEEESEMEQEREATANAGQVQESGGNTSSMDVEAAEVSSLLAEHRFAPDMPTGQDGSSIRGGQQEQENEAIPKSQASSPNTPVIMAPSGPSILLPPSQTANEEAVANSLVATLSQSSNAQNDSIPSPLEAPLVDHRDEVIPSSCSPPAVQQNNLSSPKSPIFTSPGAGTYFNTSHMDDHDDFQNTENVIVKAKEELNTPRQMSTVSTEYLHIPSASPSPLKVKAKPKPKPKPKAEIVAKQEIIDIDSLPTPKKMASKGKKKVQASNRESSIISISSDSEIEVIDPIPSIPSSRPSNSAASRKQKPSLKLMNRKLPVKLDIFTQPDLSSSRRSPVSTPSQLQMTSSSSGNKRTEVGESTADVDFETTDHKAEEVEKPALEVPASPSTPGFSPPRNFSQQGSSPSPRTDNIEPHVPSSPLSEPPSGSESKSDAEPTSSFDIAKYTAKLEDDDDADIIRAKPKSVGTDTTKTGLQAMIANKKKAKENNKALTKIKKRKRVSDPTSLGLGSGIDGEGEEDMMDKPPLKRVKARTQAQKENERASARKGKAKEPEKDKSRTPRARQLPDEENLTSISSQSRYPLRSPRKSASTSISATSSSARATKTPIKKSRISDILKSVKWPVIPEPDFSQHIECDTCEGWYHIGCVGVAANDVRLRPSAVFKCPMCEAGINKQTSPIKNVLENDFKGKNDCARPDCLRQTMRSKSKKLSPSVSTTPRGRGRSRKIEIKEESSASPTDNDEYVVESFVGRSKKYVGSRGLVVDYLVKWLDYDYEDATWQPLDSMGLTNPDILLEAFDQAARAQGYDLQNSTDEVFLLNGAAEAGWTLEKTFIPRKRK
ncbi:hypothetical protein CPC08DRAFT_702264 [Agrocybe pediades]|nr:hypothetical protein CPC08DRAFT_702264 [Agrocybe pediades]